MLNDIKTSADLLKKIKNLLKVQYLKHIDSVLQHGIILDRELVGPGNICSLVHKTDW